MIQAPAPELPASLARMWRDLRDELTRRPALPPGPTRFSIARTHRFQRDTLRMLLACYERYGPVFTIRVFHRLHVVMLGPEANHFVTVAGAENFSWRRGEFGEELIPLIGDGLITTDGDYHDRARRLMMPAFHRRRLDAAVEVMVEETERALESWTPGATVDVYAWVRDLAMSIAMRALIGLDPHDGEKGHEMAEWFERALSFYNTEAPLLMLRGPGSPWARMQAARRRLDRMVYTEIQRRRHEKGGSGEDILSRLLDARDEDGQGFTDRELRDHLMTMLFGGHDTSSSTFSFLVYELARNPEVLERVLVEQDRVLRGRAPSVDQLTGELPELGMALDETLRLYPPVWFGPRMAVKDFEFGGHRIPAGTHIIHSSWASHRLPEVFADPDAFIPERFAPEARAALPKGAYIPFGGGQRICIGKRFGQLVVKTAASVVLQRFGLGLAPAHELRMHTVPTLTPRGGLPMVVRERPTPTRTEEH